MFGVSKQTINDLEETIQEQSRTLSRLEEQIDDYKKTIAAFPGVKADYDVKLADNKQKYNKEVSTLRKQLKELESSVNQKVNDTLSAMGVNTFLAETIYTPPRLTAEEALNTFNLLTGDQKTEFYKKNKDLLQKAIHGSPNI